VTQTIASGKSLFAVVGAKLNCAVGGKSKRGVRFVVEEKIERAASKKFCFKT
jgi:hypothetical protein